MFKQEYFIRKKEATIARQISKMFDEQKKGLVEILEREQKSWETKSILDQAMQYIEDLKIQIPDYLFFVLQDVMDKAYKQAYKPYKNLLKDYKNKLVFNIETEPAVRYLRGIQNLHLSERDGSIYKTTKKEILTILTEGVKSGKSYTQIGKEIRETSPFVFSKSRAELIAIQEVGQSYGWANFQPAKEMQRRGYKMVKLWSTVKDSLVRDSHRENANAGYIDLDTPFPGTGDMFAPSRDFRCRCTSITKILE